MLIRERLENQELEMLSPRAAHSANTRGRMRQIPSCDLRTEFQRDRDRILHSKAFRRLKHKTQVFIEPKGDHIRTRLTHTLEVSQIARTIARALALNEDLTEAIALGHDLGHTPFGHIGERTLDRLTPGGFSHREHSLRIVDVLEDLNLTWEVRDGIVHHSGLVRGETLEADIVHLSDRIAYINHDIDDALRSGTLMQSDLPTELIEILGPTHGARIDCMVRDVVANSEKGSIAMSPKIMDATMALRGFMYDRVYTNAYALEQERRAGTMIEMLYQDMLDHPGSLVPDAVIGEDRHRAVCDAIAGMTDSYLVRQFRRRFMPISFV